MAAENEDDQRGTLSSLRRIRIAVESSEGCPSRDEIGVEKLGAAAVEWQTERNHNDFRQLGLVLKGSKLSLWVPEIHGLLGAAGELVIVTAEAEAEVILAERQAVDATETHVKAGAWRSARFFSEAQANNLIVFGHSIVNLVVRTFALYPDVSMDPLSKRFVEMFEPRSHHRDAWLSLNRNNANALSLVAKPLGSPADALAEAVLALVNGAWGDLNEHRGGQYHRWRGEGPGFPAVGFNAPRMYELLNAGEPVSFGEQPDYQEGIEIVESLVSAVRSTMAQLEDWMPLFLSLWRDVYADIRTTHGL